LGSFAETPDNLKDYCDELIALARGREQQATPIEWAAVWRNFWSLWDFQPTGVAIRPLIEAPAAIGMAVLHAARHGGIPLMPHLRGNPSIGQWWRLVTLATFGDEGIPSTAVGAAFEALGFPEAQFYPGSFSGIRTRFGANVPILFISVVSAASPAWSWPPDKGVRAIIPPPRGFVAADATAVQSSRLVEDAFKELKQRAMTRERTYFVRFFLRGLFRLGRTLSIIHQKFAPLFSWWPFRMTRLRAGFVRLRRDRRLRVRRSRDLNFVECIEISPDFKLPEIEPTGSYVYFGFGQAPAGITGYIASPTGVADLMRRIRETEEFR